MDEQTKSGNGNQSQASENELKQKIEGGILRANAMPAEMAKFSQVSHSQDVESMQGGDLPVAENVQEQIQEFATRLARAKDFGEIPEPNRQ